MQVSKSTPLPNNDRAKVGSAFAKVNCLYVFTELLQSSPDRAVLGKSRGSGVGGRLLQLRFGGCQVTVQDA